MKNKGIIGILIVTTLIFLTVPTLSVSPSGNAFKVESVETITSEWDLFLRRAGRFFKMFQIAPTYSPDPGETINFIMNYDFYTEFPLCANAKYDPNIGRDCVYTPVEACMYIHNPDNIPVDSACAIFPGGGPGGNEICEGWGGKVKTSYTVPIDAKKGQWKVVYKNPYAISGTCWVGEPEFSEELFSVGEVAQCPEDCESKDGYSEWKMSACESGNQKWIRQYYDYYCDGAMCSKNIGPPEYKFEGTCGGDIFCKSDACTACLDEPSCVGAGCKWAISGCMFPDPCSSNCMSCGLISSCESSDAGCDWCGGCWNTGTCNYCCNSVCQSEPCGLPDSCEGVVCQDMCDGSILKSNGNCVEGKCVYSTEVCDSGCKSGRCGEPPILRLVFIPVNWASPYNEFLVAVDEQANFLIENYGLDKCRDKIQITKSREICTVFDTGDPGLCRSSKTIVGIKECSKRVVHEYKNQYIIGIMDKDCRGSGLSSGGSRTVFVSRDAPEITAHEIGHEFGLRDEYCDKAPYCGANASPNPLEAKYGCDADVQMGLFDAKCGTYDDNRCCWDRGKYEVTCCGNINSLGGRSIMSFSNAPGPRIFEESAQQVIDAFIEMNLGEC